MLLARRHQRLWLAAALTAAILLFALAPQQRPAVGQGAAPGRALQVSAAGTPAAPALRIVAPERFALTIDGAGLAAWADLAADPPIDVTAPGERLLAHVDAAGVRLAGTPRLVRLSPLRAVVRVDGVAGGDPAALTYTVWAGGQVVVEPDAGTTLTTTLRLDPDAPSGATLQPLAGGRGTALLTLGTWASEGLAPASAATNAAAAGETIRDATGALAATYAGAGALRLSAPPDALRQPRFHIAGWPGPEARVSLAGVPLVEGTDYLADWEAATGELSFQYLGLLTPDETAGRTFEVDPAQTSVLSLEILNRTGSAARTLAPDGLLRVDANLSNAATGTATVLAIFDIPYIQTWPDLRLRATVANPPAGFQGVRFAVSGPGFSQTVHDTNGADGYGAVVALPRRAEYSVTASALVGDQPAEPSRSITRVAYGRVFVSIGDSITAGKWGFYRNAPPLTPNDGFPFSRPPASGYPQSTDGRNYPQQDSTKDELATGTPTQVNSFYAGYQVPLNDKLAQCLNAPVFILNEGISGIRTGRDVYIAADPTDGGVGTQGKVNILDKAATIRGHIGQLGAEHLLLQTGTNDASTVTVGSGNDPLPPEVYNSDLRAVISALREGRPGLDLWVARIPWRDNGVNAAQAEARRAKTITFNAEIVSIVNDLGASAPIRSGPDFYSHFEQNQAQLDVDRLHPNTEGLAAMANLWSQTICDSIDAEAPPPSVTPSTTPVTPSTTPVTPSTTPVTPSPSPCPDAGGGPCPAPNEKTYLPSIRRVEA